MFSRLVRIFLLLEVILISIHAASGIAVMAIDLGSECMKVAIVSPGVPMEIALNRDSQRKTPVMVCFRDGERLFAEAAASASVRFPEKCYSHFLELLGKETDHPLVKAYQKKFPHATVIPHEERGTVTLLHPDGMTFTPEELLAMVLKYAQEFAQAAAGQPIKDAVITVPPFFNQAERRSLVRAVEMAGLNLLQLLNDNTAVALHYGVFRRKDFNETSQHIMFYDMGASNTVATVVAYQMVKMEKGFAETHPQLTVKGIGFDRTLGSLEMQMRLRDHFANIFKEQKKTKADIFKSNRALAKLLKEAGRVKKVLSANVDHIAQVENLLADQDFRTPVSRAELEDMSQDLFERVGGPVDMALKTSGLTMDEVDQVILVGAGTRIPKVQQVLLEMVKKPELGKSVNTDEAAALGAAYQAAHLSKGFKVKTFLLKDANLFPIQVEFQRQVEQDGEPVGVKTVHRTLFGLNNPYPQKKVMTFNRHTKDFEFVVSYGELGHLPPQELVNLGSINLTRVSLSGVEAALQKHSGESTEVKGVKAHFKLDESGILNLEQVESVFEKKIEEEEEEKLDLESTLSKLGSTIGKLFSGMAGDKPEEDAVPTQHQDSEQPPPTGEQKDDKEKAQTDSNQSTPEGKDAKPAEQANETNIGEKVPKIVVVKEPVVINLVSLDLADLTGNQITNSKAKLQELDGKDKAKWAREKAKNALESYIIETRDRLHQPNFKAASTEEERERIAAKMSESSDWLEYESDDSKTEAFREKLTQLRGITRELFDRVKEHQERPEALKALTEILNVSEYFYRGVKNVSQQDQVFTEVEVSTLEKLITQTKKWKIESEKEQADTPLTQMPKLTVAAIAEKIAALDREMKYLIAKARFSPPKKQEDKETDATKSDEKSNATEGDSSEEYPEELVLPTPEVDEKKSKKARRKEEPAEQPEETLHIEDTSPSDAESGTEPLPDKVVRDEHTEL